MRIRQNLEKFATLRKNIFNNTTEKEKDSDNSTNNTKCERTLYKLL